MKKILSIILSLLLVFGTTVVAFATETETEAAETEAVSEAETEAETTAEICRKAQLRPPLSRFFGHFLVETRKCRPTQ